MTEKKSFYEYLLNFGDLDDSGITSALEILNADKDKEIAILKKTEIITDINSGSNTPKIIYKYIKWRDSQ